MLGSSVGTFPVSVRLESAGRPDEIRFGSVASAVLESWTAIDDREWPFNRAALDADMGVDGVAGVGEVDEMIFDTGISGGRAGRTPR